MSKSTKKATNTAAAVSEAIATARAELDRVDAEVARLREKRQAIAGAPCTRDEAKAAVGERVNAAAAAGRKRIAAEAARFARGSGTDFDPRELMVRWIWSAESWKPDVDVLLALTARELEQQVRATIDADKRYDGENVMPSAERAKRLQQLDREIAEAEQRRDDLLAELDAAGLQIGGETGAPAPTGGDRGERALREQHERQRQETNRALQRAGVAERAQPRVVRAFEPVRRVSVGED